MSMAKQKIDLKFLSVVLLGAVTTLVLTPWINVDALVVPKVIIVFCGAMVFLPLVVLNGKYFFQHWRLKMLFFLAIWMVIQMLFVIFLNSAPIEQQVFGKTSRGLGFLMEVSILIFILFTSRYIRFQHLHYLINGLVISTIITSVYSILQRFGLDLFTWYSRTNGIIGTLGNPNFQSALAAIAIVPATTYLRHKGLKPKVLALILCSVLAYTIYICQSTQGYILVSISIVVNLLIYLWYQSKQTFIGSLFIIIPVTIYSILGMFNIGLFSNFLHKESVTSRGEFFRTAIAGANDNPIFGVGLDSFGDVSQFYKNVNDSAGINEFTDSAHNYFLQYAVTGGYPLAILYLLLTLLTLGSFFVLQKRIGEFSFKLSAIFSAWMGFQAQSLISPGSIPIILWGSIFSGSIIGLSVLGIQEGEIQIKSLNSLFKPSSYFLLFFGLLLIYPYFNADRLQLKSLITRDAFLAVKSSKMYPEAVLRYSQIGVKLLESGLPDQALEVGRAAVKFNPNAVSAWALILANKSAPLEERKNAQKEILRLDPFNDEIRRIEFPSNDQ